MKVSIEQLERSTEKTYARSSGPGGQNVNKTSTKVQLEFDIRASDLHQEYKARLLRKFSDGFIRVQSQETRSQSQNTRIAFELLQEKIEEALRIQKPRKNTKAPHQTKTGKVKKMLKNKWLKYKQRYLER